MWLSVLIRTGSASAPADHEESKRYATPYNYNIFNKLAQITGAHWRHVALHLSRLRRHTLQQDRRGNKTKRAFVHPVSSRCPTCAEPDAGIVVNLSSQPDSVLSMTSAQSNTSLHRADGVSLPALSFCMSAFKADLS
jgi:hypothetical protein